jgi:hypothetical protein
MLRGSRDMGWVDEIIDDLMFVALMFFFRGFIASAIVSSSEPWWEMIISGLLFVGLYGLRELREGGKKK